MFKSYFKTAIRNLLHSKVYSFINITGLSIGLACAMLIILYVKDEVSYDRFHKNAKQIYLVAVKGHFSHGPNNFVNYMSVSGYLQGPKFKAAIPEIQGFVRYQGYHVDMKSGTNIISQGVTYVDSNFFSMFSFPLLRGNPKTALLNPHSIVLSEQMAKKQFGSTDVLGKTILIKNNEEFQPYTVTGISKTCPQNSSIKFEVLLPIRVSAEEEAKTDNWSSFFLGTFIMLSPDANIKSVESKMQKTYEADAADMIKKNQNNPLSDITYILQPLTDIHLNKEIPNQLSDVSNPVYSYILSGIALLILLIACINFINLTVARSINRAKEIGIRKISGGHRKQLIVQFMGESFLLCFIAFGFALILAKGLLPIFSELSNKALELSYLLDYKLIISYIALFLITGFLAGLYPALVLSKYNPAQTLYGRFQFAGKNYLQKSLVVLQFSFASFLIMATITIFSQFNFLTTEKLGYDDSNLVLVEKMDLKQNEAALFRQELLKYPGIVDMTAKNRWYTGTTGKINGDKDIEFSFETIDESYLPLLKVPIVKGRNFSANQISDSGHSVIVNESFAKKAGWKNPLGQPIEFWSRKFVVIGVVKDFHVEPLNVEISPKIFVDWPPFSMGVAYIKIQPDNKQASLQHIAKVFRTLFPNSPYSYTFKDLENQKNYESEARWKQIMLFGALLTILVSCVGLFGLSVFSAEKRTKEIGIRKVLGASVQRIISILSKDFLILVVIALLISIPLTWIAANKWLQNYPYRISLSWSIFAAGSILVILIAIATISFQAIKAAITNPVKSLRSE
ncbi:MAG TPA: ABC transporter permease [Puia sp.]|nr:ABC transporter permease [Puia sp.]